MLRDGLSMSSIILGLENVLHINYNEPEINSIMYNSISSLESMYNVKFDTSIWELQVKTQFVSTSITELITQISEGLKSLALLTSISLYDKCFTETLQDVEYCGYGRERLLTYFKYLQDVDYYNQKESFFASITNAMDKLPMCNTKKLLIIMLILDRLDIREGVSLIANHLYAGGVMVG